MFWEILQKLAEPHSTADVFLTTIDGILLTAHTHEDSQLQSDSDRKLGSLGGVEGPSGGVGDVLGAGRECRYSGQIGYR